MQLKNVNSKNGCIQSSQIYVFFQALYEINLITATAIATGYMFYRINPLAGYLFVPYVAWLGLATWLNYSIVRDNPSSVTITELDKDE